MAVLSAKTAATTLVDTDLMYLLRDPSGTPLDRKVPVSTVRSQLMPTANAIAAGTVYTLTNTSAKVDYGTTDPVIVIPAAGSWLIWANAQTNFVGATFAAPQSVSYKIRRTNNTAADVADSTRSSDLPVITTLTGLGPSVALGPILYVTANTDDALELWGALSAAPAAGSVTVSAASILAMRVA